jgi:hypothetical protein
MGGGTERTDPYPRSPVFCAYLLCLLHLFSSTIFSHCPPPWPLSFLPHDSRRRAPWLACGSGWGGRLLISHER